MLQDFETARWVSAVSHGTFDPALDPPHRVQGLAWIETCFKEWEGENQIKLFFRIVILERPVFFCAFSSAD